MSQEIIQPSTAKTTPLKPGYNPSLGPIQLPASYQNAVVSKGKTIYDQSLSRRTPEVNIASLSFLFAGIVQYVQSQSKSIQDIEARLNALGYGVGTKFLELVTLRDGKNAKRETRIVGVLQFIQMQVWKTLFGKPADELQKASDSENQYMIFDNVPLISQFICVPKEFGKLNVGAFTAGIIEGVLDAAHFQANVGAHTVDDEGSPLKTVFLIDFDHAVIERENIRFGK
ncbi:CYFA0S06e01310g1_1 [Cyberlindnera fabianii]|uniref:Trafficking protein particle complex subunit n=1 Tax=Cyberlindnera fabianii TaxID=36022 RepID=A0A061B250_CYBFA|nr:CYFA0S06e01310g1_1 [Cyberlindnera fabianii]